MPTNKRGRESRSRESKCIASLWYCILAWWVGRRGSKNTNICRRYRGLALSSRAESKLVMLWRRHWLSDAGLREFPIYCILRTGTIRMRHKVRLPGMTCLLRLRQSRPPTRPRPTTIPYLGVYFLIQQRNERRKASLGPTGNLALHWQRAVRYRIVS